MGRNRSGKMLNLECLGIETTAACLQGNKGNVDERGYNIQKETCLQFEEDGR